VKAALALAVFLLVTVAAPAAAAAPGRIAVGALEAVPIEEVALAVEQATGELVDRALAPMGAVVVPVDDVAAALPVLRALPGVEYVEPIERSRELAFVPNDPLAETQWHLASIRAFDLWEQQPVFPAPVKVAIVDSGVDGDHPDLQGRIAAGKSFVGSRWDVDTVGHGTFVAGEIAAATGNGIGIAGVGLPVQLLVAKVAVSDGSISVEAEAQAIRWAVAQGAQVINLSLGGRRDPNNPAFDEYSPLEQAAIEYAYSHGVVIVAAVGNCPVERCPYRYASWPAALPHVIGVSAVGPEIAVPSFSNRDPVFNDIAAPGRAIVSTFPLDLSDDDPACADVGYSICAPRSPNARGDGTSFAAPLVSAAAAVLIAQYPHLSASQVMQLLVASARDVGDPGRDAATGNGVLDIASALLAAQSSVPPADQYESNDDAGKLAAQVPLGSRAVIDATIDAFDDPSDVYRVYLRRGRTFRASLQGRLGGEPWLVLWAPRTKHVTPVTAVARRSGAIVAYARGSRLPGVRVETPGFYYVEVKAPPRAGGAYRLTLESVRSG
jgi:subtilisin family serine protease